MLFLSYINFFFFLGEDSDKITCELELQFSNIKIFSAGSITNIE